MTGWILFGFISIYKWNSEVVEAIFLFRVGCQRYSCSVRELYFWGQCFFKAWGDSLFKTMNETYGRVVSIFGSQVFNFLLNLARKFLGSSKYSTDEVVCMYFVEFFWVFNHLVPRKVLLLELYTRLVNFGWFNFPIFKNVERSLRLGSNFKFAIFFSLLEIKLFFLIVSGPGYFSFGHTGIEDVQNFKAECWLKISFPCFRGYFWLYVKTIKDQYRRV